MTPPASHAQQLEFPDNRLLIDLCGPYDANLTAVETALEVQIVRRGNHLSVMGEEDATTRAELRHTDVPDSPPNSFPPPHPVCFQL